MIAPKIIKKVKSGIVQLTFKDHNDKRISSGSGFLSNDKIISNNHVFFDDQNNLLGSAYLHLRFGDTSIVKIYEYEKFMKFLSIGSDVNNNDYAIFNIPDDLDITERYQFTISDHTIVQEGEKIIIMGFPFGRENLTSHIGNISSVYKRDGINKIQIDASINPGNSGGPLIDFKSLHVVGVITRSITGLTDQFDELQNSFMKIARTIEKNRVNINISGFDIREMLSLTQKQMSELAKNIKRSANVGIGLAYSTDVLKKELSM